MKSFSFSILLVSLFAPSLLYLFTLPYMKHWARYEVDRSVREQLIQDEMDLLQGKVSLYDEVSRNVALGMKKSVAIRLGARVRVRIRDAHNHIIYPYYDHLLFAFQKKKPGNQARDRLFDANGFAVSPAAGELEQLLQRYSDYIQGMKIFVNADVPVNSWMGAGALSAYILATLLLLYIYYRRFARLEQNRIIAMEVKHETEKRTLATRVGHKLQEARKRLAEIQAQEEEWLHEVERLEKEKVSLEEELLQTLEQTEEQMEKIGKLEQKVVKQAGKKTRTVKEERALHDRFARLYRNLEFDRKAVEGLVQLRDDKMKLQAEEVLKRLNDNDPSLKVRRKIAGVEKCDAYELGFGSSGRIYYYSSDTKRYKVLRIGTKASQNKDLAYLQGRTR